MQLNLTNTDCYLIAVILLFAGSFLIWIGRRLERRHWSIGFDKIPVNIKPPQPQITANYNTDKRILTVRTGDDETEYQHLGGTEWVELPMMRACSANKTLQLIDIVRYISTHGNPYPTAHLKVSPKK